MSLLLRGRDVVRLPILILIAAWAGNGRLFLSWIFFSYHHALGSGRSQLCVTVVLPFVSSATKLVNDRTIHDYFLKL